MAASNINSVKVSNPINSVFNVKPSGLFSKAADINKSKQ